MGKRNSVLSEQDKLDVVSLYMDEKWATTKIAKKYGVWSNAINGLLRRRGIKIRERGEAHRIYPINENFFNNIDSEEKAYTLGLFYADGSVNEKKGVFIHNDIRIR